MHARQYDLCHKQWTEMEMQLEEVLQYLILGVEITINIKKIQSYVQSTLFEAF